METPPHVMNATSTIADLIAHVQPALDDAGRLFVCGKNCPLSASPMGALVFFSDGTLLYTMRLEPDTGAVTFFAMHFIDAISRGHKSVTEN